MTATRIYRADSRDPAPLIAELLAMAERDFGDLDRAGLYLDCQTVVYGDGGAHITGMDEHIVAALFILHLRQLKAKGLRERQVQQRRAAIRVCEESRDGGRS